MTDTNLTEELAAAEARRERIEDIYVDLKLRDRLTPGRTPWQTLRKQAEAIVERERIVAEVPGNPTHVLVDVVEGHHDRIAEHAGVEYLATLKRAATVELERRSRAA